MKRQILWLLKLVILICLSPFGLFLSWFPPFKGPVEWFEFCIAELNLEGR